MDHFSYSSILIDIHIFYNLSTNLLIRAKSNQRNMTTCCNNTYPRDDDHLSSRGCRHSAWKKTKLSFSSCSLIACALVFFSYLFSCTHITEQKGNCFGRIERHSIKYFWTILLVTHKRFHRNWMGALWFALLLHTCVYVEHSYANLFEEKLFCVRWLCPADHRYSGSSTSINLFAKVG